MQRYRKDDRLLNEAREVLSRIRPERVTQIDTNFGRRGGPLEVTITAYLEENPTTVAGTMDRILQPPMYGRHDYAANLIENTYTFHGDCDMQQPKLMLIEGPIMVPYNESVLNVLMRGDSVSIDTWGDRREQPYTKTGEPLKITIVNPDTLREREPDETVVQAEREARIAKLQEEIAVIRKESKASA
jgi:hypothetical protein